MTAMILLEQMIRIEMVPDLSLVSILFAAKIACELYSLVHMTNMSGERVTRVCFKTAHVTQQICFDDIAVTATMPQEQLPVREIVLAADFTLEHLHTVNIFVLGLESGCMWN